MKKPMRKWCIVAIALGAVTVAAAILYTQCWIPNRKLMDMAWHEQAGKAEQVRVAHQVLRFPWGNHHDAFIIILRDGGPESVPYLISALRWQRHTAADGMMVCTKACCLEALRRITGHDAGNNYSDWARWWKEKNGTPAANAAGNQTEPAWGKAVEGVLDREITWRTDRAQMVLVPAGSVLVDRGDRNGIKKEKVRLDAFYIDKFEVTNERFLKFLQEGKHRPDEKFIVEPARNDILWKDGRWNLKEGREQYPARATFAGARAYCKWAGKQLPTWSQYMRAACGDDGRRYPWGNEWDPSRVGRQANAKWGLAPVGSKPTGASPFGAQDLAGSLGEWVLFPPRQLHISGFRGLQKFDRALASGTHTSEGRFGNFN